MKWYKYESLDGPYYTWKPKSGRKWLYAGEGNQVPTPKQAVELLNSLSPSSHVYGNGCIQDDHYKDHTEPSCELPSGSYRIVRSSYGDEDPDRFVPIDIRDDKYTRMPSLLDPIIKDIDSFIASEPIYRKVGSHYKRGILLYGPPGEGKSALIRDLLRNELKDAVTLFLDAVPSAEFLNAINKGLKERLKVFVFEELLSAVEQQFDKLLRFLDGEVSSDKSMVFATTNYPEKLPQNIVDRPSRFDKVYKMGDPNIEQRTIILNHYLMRPATDVEIEQTSGLSTAAIKEVAFLVHLQHLTVQEAAKKLKDHSALVKNDFAAPRKLGLSRNFGDDD